MYRPPSRLAITSSSPRAVQAAITDALDLSNLDRGVGDQIGISLHPLDRFFFGLDIDRRDACDELGRPAQGLFSCTGACGFIATEDEFRRRCLKNAQPADVYFAEIPSKLRSFTAYSTKRHTSAWLAGRLLTRPCRQLRDRLVRQSVLTRTSYRICLSA